MQIYFKMQFDLLLFPFCSLIFVLDVVCSMIKCICQAQTRLETKQLELQQAGDRQREVAKEMNELAV